MLAASIAGAVVLAAGAYSYAEKAWNGVVDYESPYAAVDLPASTETSVVAPRVVLVIVDGLRLDASRRMSSMESLRGYGADLVVSTAEPSLSYPNWTTILSGTTQDHHGVVTNWHEGASPVETLLDTADRANVPFVVVGPSDLATLYPAALQADASYFDEWSDEYLSATYVDKTLEFVAEKNPRFVLLHLPDIDESGHDFGGTSDEYETTVARVDGDLRRLVEGLQDTQTAFVVVSDHGHVDSGGHGGWEAEVTRVPCVIAGAGVRAMQGEAAQEDVAPTVAVLAGLPVPRHSTGTPIAATLGSGAAKGRAAARLQRGAAVAAFMRVLGGADGDAGRPPFVAETTDSEITASFAAARSARLERDRESRRLGTGLFLSASSLAALLLAGTASWRALVAALSGSAAYYAVYNGLFFLVHGNRWSLSAFNSEDLMDSWMNTRLIEAAVAGLIAAAVASVVYPMLRREPKGPHGRYLAGWLTLGPLAVMVTQLTLALQIAWFDWAWGVTPVWGLPDLMWGFKFDLDLVQVTALGVAAVLAPVVSYVVGRYHPRMRAQRSVGKDFAEEDTASAAPLPTLRSDID